MGTINEFNSCYYKTCFQMDEKSENVIRVSLVQEYFQHLLTLLKNETKINREITACPSDMQAMTTARVLARGSIGKAKVSKDRTLVCQGTEAESWRNFSGK
ncbi:MAG TPA: hypothetical protein VGK06_03315 [Methanosarcina sp.]|jgi:vacuolar-type H+-ATPase subunit C/Vma6